MQHALALTSRGTTGNAVSGLECGALAEIQEPLSWEFGIPRSSPANGSYKGEVDVVESDG